MELFDDNNFNCSICEIDSNQSFCQLDLISSCCQEDCNKIFLPLPSGEGTPKTVWIACVITVVLFFPIIVLVIYLVQRFCFTGRRPYNTVTVARPYLTFEKFIQTINVIDKDKKDTFFLEKLNEQCCICLDPLVSRDCAYFTCKLHIGHVDCFYNYEKEKFSENKTEICPYRCEKAIS